MGNCVVVDEVIGDALVELFEEVLEEGTKEEEEEEEEEEGTRVAKEEEVVEEEEEGEVVVDDKEDKEEVIGGEADAMGGAVTNWDKDDGVEDDMLSK